jgi:hypothetical protein
MPRMTVQHHAHPTVEIVATCGEKVDKFTDNFDLANRSFRAIAGSHAFYKYDWIRALPTTNASGNLRGMVISARWRTVFNFSSEVVGKYAEGIGTLASVATDIAKDGWRFESIWKSQDSPFLKGMQFASLVGTMANHALLGIVPTGASAIYTSLEGYCRVMGLAGGQFQSAADQCINTLNQADAYVQTSYKYVTDNSNLSRNTAWLINLRFTSR